MSFVQALRRRIADSFRCDQRLSDSNVSCSKAIEVSSFKALMLISVIIMVFLIMMKSLLLVFDIDTLPSSLELPRLYALIAVLIFSAIGLKGDALRKEIISIMVKYFQYAMILVSILLCVVALVTSALIDDLHPKITIQNGMVIGVLLAVAYLHLRNYALRILFLAIYFGIYIIGTVHMMADSYSQILDFLAFSTLGIIALNVEHSRSEKMIESLTQRLENEKDYKLLLDALSESIVIIGPKLKVLHANSAFARVNPDADDIYFNDEEFREVKLRDMESNEQTMKDTRFSSIFHYLSEKAFESRRSTRKMTGQNLSLVEIINGLLTAKDEAKARKRSSQFLVFDAIWERKQSLDQTRKVLESEPRTPRNVELRLCPAKFSDTNSVLLAIHDVSQLKENIELKEKDKLKTLLLGSVSHEVRSPLNAIISLLTCAEKDQKVDQEVKTTYINLALINSKLLLHIVNDILDYTQLDFNKIRIVPIEFNLRDKMDEIVHLLSFQAMHKKLELRLEFDPENELPRRVKTDPNRLAQIIINLINNALKFTEEGSITLHVRPGSEYNTVFFAVEDTGIGIKPDDQAKLFSVFTKIDLGDKVVLNTSGAGLGLTLCQNLLKLLGSNGMQVESEAGEGSRFYFELPCVVPSPSISSNMQHSAEGPANVPGVFNVQTLYPHSSKKLLPHTPPRRHRIIIIVDDNPFNLLALEMLLKEYDQKILKFTSSRDLLAFFENACAEDQEVLGNIALMIFDLEMPIMNGLDLLSRVKETMAEKNLPNNIPIVACSGNVSQQVIDNALEAGFLDYMIKPVQPEKLHQIMQSFLA